MIKLRTNTKEYKEKLTAYLIESIESEHAEGNTLQDQLQYVADEFDRVANYKVNIHNLPNLVDRFADYMQGLPDWWCGAWNNSQVIQLIEKLHGIDSNELTEDQCWSIHEKYWTHIAQHILALLKANKIEVKNPTIQQAKK